MSFNRVKGFGQIHYYPFGLTMAGISSQALGKVENKYKFNNGSELQQREFSDNIGLDWYATQYRMYDPQIGRWHVIDPKPSEMYSLYSGMDNNPLLKNDPFGDTTVLTPYGTTFWLPDDAKVETFDPNSNYSIGEINMTGQDLGGKNGVSAFTIDGERFVPYFDTETGLLDSYKSESGKKSVFTSEAIYIENLAIKKGYPLQISGEGSTGNEFAQNFAYNKNGNLIGKLTAAGMFAPIIEGAYPNTSFRNITKGNSIPNFDVGMRLSEFNTQMSKISGKGWSVSLDGKVKTLEHNGLRYISREFSKSAGNTVEIWQGTKLVQKYRLAQ